MSSAMSSALSAWVPDWMTEPVIHTALSWVLILSAVGVCIAEQLGVKAPYGKFVIAKTTDAQGKPLPPQGCLARLTAWAINPRVAWCVMESPCSVAAALGAFVFGTATCVGALPNRVLLLLFTVHYVNRAWVYPFRLSPSTAPVPVFIAFNGWLFCVLNGYLQTRALTALHTYPPDWERDPRFVVGCAVFVLGLIGNLHADHILRTLRKPGETGYKIPRGGLFHWVSTANYTAEIFEWFGFAVACWSFSAAAFSIFTLLHLGARAVQNHHWLLQKFGAAYPRGRKMVIPFIY